MVDIEKVKQQIIEKLKPLDIYKVILFGSYAYGAPHEDSDIDLYVVTNDDFIPQSFREKMNVKKTVLNKLRTLIQEYPTDLKVHTKTMYENFKKINSSFSKEILTKGEVLHG
jgi:predicted nucleotidyltransferase